MTVAPDTRTGTITLTSGSVNFTTTGVNLITRDHLPGDTIFSNGLSLIINTIIDENNGTLVDPCPAGAAGVALPVRIRFQPDGSRVKAESRNLIEVLGNGMLESFAGLDGSGGDKIVKLSGVGIAEAIPARSVIALAATEGELNTFPMYTGPDGVVMVPRIELTNGLNYDVQVATLADRAAYDGRPQGFSVLVSDIGDGRAAVYSKLSATSGDWSVAAIITGAVGPAADLEAGTATGLPYGNPPTVTLNPITGGYQLNLGIPAGQPSTIPGPTGPAGDGLEIDATGLFSGRAAYDSQPAGFTYVATDTGMLYFRQTATAGVWSTGIPFGKGDKGDPGDSGALITTTNGTGNGTAGPYTLSAAPIDNNSVWASISGVVQYNWTLSGLNITFGQIVPTGVAWQVKTSGPLPVGTATVANDTINASKIDGSDAAAIRTKIAVAQTPAVAPVDGRVPVFDGVTGRIKDSGLTTADLTPSGYNSLLLSVSVVTLQVADNTSAALFGSNWVADSFKTLTYVDVAGATGLDSSTSGVLKPSVPADSYSTTVDPTLTTNAGDNGGYSGRQVFASSLLNVSGSKIRLTFTPVTTAGQNTVILECFIGERSGTTANFVSTPTRVTFSGANGTTLTGGGASILSDTITFSFDKAKDYIVAFNHAAISYVRVNSSGGTGYTYYEKAATSGESGNTTVTGYSAGSAGLVIAIDKIEVVNPLGTIETPTAAMITMTGVTVSSVAGTVDGNIATNGFHTDTAVSGATIQIDYGTGVTKALMDWRYYVSGTNAAIWAIEYSDNASSWTQIATLNTALFGATGAGWRAIVWPNAGAHRYWRSRLTNTPGSGSYHTEILVYGPPTLSALTVRSTSFSSLTVPTKMKALIRVKEIDTAIAGTDYTLECSRDGGTTWTNMTLTDSFVSPSPTAGIQVVEAAETNVASQPSGTAPRWRFKTLNKNVELHDCKLDWN